MTKPSTIRKFQYRPFRIDAGFGVDFVAAGVTLHGICRDVSNSGVRAALEGSVTVGDSGLLILRPSIGVLEVEAKVAYIGELHVGFEFLFKTPWECTTTTAFVSSIASHSTTALAVRRP